MNELLKKEISQNFDFYEIMMETSGSGGLPAKILSHREAVLPFSWVGSRCKLVFSLL
jgi:hypothetical protein